jgi:dihydropteroate synthase
MGLKKRLSDHPDHVFAGPQQTMFPLAGCDHVWFDTVLRRGDGGVTEYLRACDLPKADLDRLSAPRPALCGLSLDKPRVLGIVNVTPDSFSDGGAFLDLEVAVARATEMAKEVDLIEIGGESTRPGAEDVPADEELRRTVPVIRAVREAGITTPISIDTRKARVARAALESGANIVNDVSGLRHDPEMLGLVIEYDVPTCLMHSRGTPETMASLTQYDDVLLEVYDDLAAQVEAAVAAGIRRESLFVDPGIGFAKALEHNLTLLRGLSIFHDFGVPILLGASRKRFIREIGGGEEAKDTLGGSLAVALQGAMQGAQILRVHDTQATAQAMRLHVALQQDDE